MELAEEALVFIRNKNKPSQIAAITEEVKVVVRDENVLLRVAGGWVNENTWFQGLGHRGHLATIKFIRQHSGRDLLYIFHVWKFISGEDY